MIKYFLSGRTVRDYTVQNTPYEEQIRRVAELIDKADIILIGAGAGASAAAGLTYSGERFTSNFGEFIEKYGKIYMTDMYTAGFEEKRMFATQGDYGMIQCEQGCHQKIYDVEELFHRMDRERKDCLIPSELVPKCPVCGGNMAMHLRCDQYFVEDEAWYEAADRYGDFLGKMENCKGVVLELGVGFNTPAIIRFPFEKMAQTNRNLTLVRINQKDAFVPESLGDRAVGIKEDLVKTISDLCFEMEKKAGASHDRK